ncbi:MAG: YraN family protein [Treponema sp.]|nr:YraN family protein [Treponema sp.]
MAEQKKSTVQKGHEGEDRAVKYLESQGYKIEGRNFRTRRGEIDIIASKEDLLVFVEVKALPHGNPEILAHELNSRKQQKIIETAKFYLEKYRQYNSRAIRFDVLAIDVPELEPVHHIVNAFSE